MLPQRRWQQHFPKLRWHSSRKTSRRRTSGRLCIRTCACVRSPCNCWPACTPIVLCAPNSIPEGALKYTVSNEPSSRCLHLSLPFSPTGVCAHCPPLAHTHTHTHTLPQTKMARAGGWMGGWGGGGGTFRSNRLGGHIVRDVGRLDVKTRKVHGQRTCGLGRVAAMWRRGWVAQSFCQTPDPVSEHGASESVGRLTSRRLDVQISKQRRGLAHCVMSQMQRMPMLKGVSSGCAQSPKPKITQMNMVWQADSPNLNGPPFPQRWTLPNVWVAPPRGPRPPRRLTS